MSLQHVLSMKALPLLSVFAAAVLLAACEDVPPDAYDPQYIVETVLIVDHPIEGVRISRSQSVTDTFRLRNGIVSDADVRIVVDGRTIPIVYRPDSALGSYAATDTALRVEPGKTYSLEIRTADGAFLTAQTLTPGRVEWTMSPKDTVTMPAKTDSNYLHPDDSLDLRWTEVAGVANYLIGVQALDTVGYGIYLNPPTSDTNRRTDPQLDDQIGPRRNDIVRWGFLAGTRTPIAWAVFQWFGRQRVTLYAADPAFVNWFKMVYFSGNPQYDPLLGNVRGEHGLGVFGSASVAVRDVFVKMR